MGSTPTRCTTLRSPSSTGRARGLYPLPVRASLDWGVVVGSNPTGTTSFDSLVPQRQRSRLITGPRWFDSTRGYTLRRDSRERR